MFFRRKKEKQLFINKINEIISDTDYKIVVYQKFYRSFGDILLKLVAPGKMNVKIITNRGDIFFNNEMIIIPDKLKSLDEIVIEVVEAVFKIIKCHDWRLNGQEKYLLYAEVIEVNPSEYISKYRTRSEFHTHCEFCMNKVEENLQKKHYCTTDYYRWICNECFEDFKEMFNFSIADSSTKKLFLTSAQRKRKGGTAYIELQYCNFKEGTSIKKIVNKIEHKHDDSLYIHIDDIDCFIEEYGEIFNCGIYNNLENGIIDIFGVNYYPKEETLQTIAKIKDRKPKDYEILISWLDKVKKCNGFYFLGI